VQCGVNNFFINKSELISATADESGLSMADAKRALWISFYN
jgi:hypothetical protein